ncbi:uncharacterized protein LACBIDRAFT_295064 [Laccaria bicolor S238N-H82]|uniref:Predicted protein n=1 Tax=Laccaria bicolor (strain S238N-H82 / ATCC MYA-4686) TaxID=486041 RepID=B0DM83_LACBS|nr:uncharacterized protein LACBIDRAFT_295064 [Laccaria bicolor S238N-H82]EDR04151.1 predicted protein [Laccaria bicolor S238N-H82]|eukprot:XP_001885042.1 predicted protein [Laccaria bicolor S238N-H82]
MATVEDDGLNEIRVNYGSPYSFEVPLSSAARLGSGYANRLRIRNFQVLKSIVGHVGSVLTYRRTLQGFPKRVRTLKFSGLLWCVQLELPMIADGLRCEWLYLVQCLQNQVQNKQLTIVETLLLSRPACPRPVPRRDSNSSIGSSFHVRNNLALCVAFLSEVPGSHLRSFTTIMGSSQSFYPCSPSSSLLELWELDTPRSAVFVWTLDTNQTEKEKGNGRGKAKGKKSDEAFVAAVSDATVVASTVLQDAIPGQFTSNQSSLLPHQSLKSQNRSRLVCHHHQRRYSSLHHQFSFCPLQQQDRTTLNHSPPPSPPHATHEQPNNQRPPLIWTGRGTRVEPRRHSNLAAAAQAVTTTSDVATNTASSSPVAERMENEEEEDKEEGAHSSFLSNSNTRDGADDILETPDHPTLSRVMRVQPRTDADDEGCGAVESKIYHLSYPTYFPAHLPSLLPSMHICASTFTPVHFCRDALFLLHFASL